MKTQDATTDFSAEAAQEQFERIVTEYRHTALWFLNDDIAVSLQNPVADRILDTLANTAPRSTWITIRKLKKWRSLRFR
jgi:hypothetical protein